MLSRVKHEVEQHLQAVKNHLQQLDATRKSLRAKINSFSHNLGLDAQNFKVRGGEAYVCLRVDGKELKHVFLSQLYDGPLAVRSEAVSRQRQYASGHPLPRTRTEDEAAGRWGQVD